MRVWTTASIALLFVLRSPSAYADDVRVRKLSYNPRIDTAVTATAALWLIASSILQNDLVPEKCRWCYRAPDGASTLNAVDRSVRRELKWRDERSADLASSVVAFVVMPSAALGLPTAAAAHDHALDAAPVDALLTAEATLLAANLNQLVKFAFARERPFVHYLPRTPDGLRALTASPSDDNLSFYSGHTNLAFALAASSGTIAFMRGYRLAPLVLGVGLAGAFSVGYLRIAADKHYFSDVTVGAVLGSLVGALVPLVFHPPSSAEPAVGATSASPLQVRTPFVIDGVW